MKIRLPSERDSISSQNAVQYLLWFIQQATMLTEKEAMILQNMGFSQLDYKKRNRQQSSITYNPNKKYLNKIGKYIIK